MSPVAGNLVIAWSVNGVANYEQSDASFNFVIAAGEEKTISVVVAQGACSASNAITVVGCGDCSNFDAQVRIIDSGRRDVSTQDCLPAGIYTVQATAPAGAGNTSDGRLITWWITLPPGHHYQWRWGRVSRKL